MKATHHQDPEQDEQDLAIARATLMLCRQDFAELSAHEQLMEAADFVLLRRAELAASPELLEWVHSAMS